MSQQNENEFKDLINRYLQGTCSGLEKRMVEDWFDRAGNINKPGFELSEQEKAKLLQKLHAAMNLHRLPPGKITTPARRFMLQTRRWTAAAVWAGLLITAAVIGWQSGWMTSLFPKKAGITFIDIKTGPGEIKQVLLPDSSQIWINANTLLSYRQDFTEHRNIRLSGEALFSVKHDKGHPFTVESPEGITTRVLGTRFNIRAYALDTETGITVVNGKVQVQTPASGTGILTQAQAIKYSKGTGTVIQLRNINTTAYTAWIRGEWVFDNMQVKDLASLLYNQYGVSLRYDSLRNGNWHTQASVNFTKKQTAKEVVEIFCALSGCRFRIIDQHLFEIL